MSAQRELAACRAMARHALQARANMGSNWLSWVLALFALAIPVIAAAAGAPWRKALGFGAGIPLTVLALLWWILLADSLARQNGPQARLVPRNRPRSVMLLLAAWSANTGVFTLLYWLAGANALYAAVAIGAVLLLVLLFVMAPALAWLAIAASAAPLVAEQLGAPLAPGLLLALRAALALWALWILGRTFIRGVTVRDQLAMPLVANAGAPGFGWRLPYPRRLRRDCAKREGAALLLHALGPNARALPLWLYLLQLAGVAALTFAEKAWLAPGAHSSLPQGFAIVVIVTQLFNCHRTIMTVLATGGEQALARLAAGAPGAAAINAILARALLRNFARDWAGSNAVMLAYLIMTGASAARLAGVLAASTLVLAYAVLLLRDYARTQAVTLGALVTAALGASALVVMSANGMLGMPAAAAIALAALACALLLGRRRLGLMLRAPVAFPAARA